MMKIPQYLHRPLQVLWWESDEFVVVMLGLILWLLFGGYYFILIGLIVPFFYSRFKKRHSRGFFGHLMYFLGFKKFKGYPEFFMKDFIE